MDPDVWRTMELDGKVTISDALITWNMRRFGGQVIHIRDSCYSPHCNSKCPEKFIVYLGGDIWSVHIKAILICMVIGVTAVCLICKATFSIWLMLLMKKHQAYQKALHSDAEQDADEHEVK